MMTMAQSTLPRSAIPAKSFSRLIVFLSRFIAPDQSLPRSRPARRQHLPCILAVLPICFLLVAGPAWAEGKPALPDGVPNLFDPEVRAQYETTLVGNLFANPDLPLLVLVSTNGSRPGAVLIALDARNGTDTWSLSADPIILIALFADDSTITDFYLDNGFLKQGTASGSFQSFPDPLEALPDLLHAVSVIPARTYL